MPSTTATPKPYFALLPLPNPSAVFRERIVFTTLASYDVPPVTRASTRSEYQVVVKGTEIYVPLLESKYHHPGAKDVRLALFCIDDVLKYSNFAFDHGPLNICQVHHFASLLNSIFSDSRNAGRAICLYSSPDERLKSNAACLLALYCILIEEQEPWEVYSCLSEMSFIPFRDASQGEADHGISIQDVIWGSWKAMKNGLLSLDEDFDAETYEWFEQPDKGDLNIIGPFIPFASPVDHSYLAKHDPKYLTPATQHVIRAERSLQDVVDYFQDSEVTMVFRLNEKLYDSSILEKRGMRHVEMHFQDGSNPPERYVREFITLADQAFSRGGKVAVHCKAGLGRTGVLIGAYLIYKYGFSPNEVIAYMRLIRPGMVVGPQQAYMNVNFATWIRWSAVDEIHPVQRTTVFGIESTAVNHASRTTCSASGKQSSDLSNVGKENITTRTVFAMKQEVVRMDSVDSQTMSLVAATPSRAREGYASQLTVARTPGQPRKTPSGKTVVPADVNPDDDTEGFELLTDRNQYASVQPELLSPNKPRTRLEALFEPPTATIAPQRLFGPPVGQETGQSRLTRKAAPENLSPTRSPKRRAVARTKSAGSATEDSSYVKVNTTFASPVRTAQASPSRIPTMMASMKSVKRIVVKSKPNVCTQLDERAIVETPRAPIESEGNIDVFGSPVV